MYFMMSIKVEYITISVVLYIYEVCCMYYKLQPPLSTVNLSVLHVLQAPASSQYCQPLSLVTLYSFVKLKYIKILGIYNKKSSKNNKNNIIVSTLVIWSSD